jgi:hypothetical protein
MPSGSRFYGDLAGRTGSGRLGVSQVKNSLCDHVESALASGSDVATSSATACIPFDLDAQANIERKCYTAEMDEGRKRVLLIAASILAARKLAQYDSGARIPATVSAIADAVRWAERIMEEIDRRHPIKPSQPERRVT